MCWMLDSLTSTKELMASSSSMTSPNNGKEVEGREMNTNVLKRVACSNGSTQLFNATHKKDGLCKTENGEWHEKKAKQSDFKKIQI